ncbi:MAG: LysM peptidoglycan-binding domain-containing protein [FCB group bacterium]|jgi:membrane-bound lytic murein transglycosylase D|nr:LysM peptidoglycan-binding domain-containing protein [FCB group bacterium]
MRSNGYRFLRDCALVMAASAVAVGCASNSGGSRQAHLDYDIPAGKDATAKTAAAHKERSTSPRSATDLLREAEAEFQTANQAQERGDYEASLRHYNKMLELLMEADLDPGIFYNLRTEFEKILKGGPGSEMKEAKLFPDKAPDWSQKALEDLNIETELKTPESLAERVQAEIQEIQELYPRNFQYGLNRSAKYVPYIQEEMKKAGLPPDLAWLAMVESQFTPKINSRAGAGGMWQFMPATGKRYGLRLDSYVDERYNWEKATKAAVAYLSDLGGRFENEWPLAVSAYNMGEGGMERAVAMMGGTKELITLIEQPPASNVLQTETKKFYPKFLASIIVAKDPERYGFTREPQAPDVTVRVPVRGCYSLAALDSASGLPEGTLHKLNPDLIRSVTPPTGEHAVAVPVEAKDSFVAALTNVPQEGRKSIFHRNSRSEERSEKSVKSTGKSTTHKVRPGETLLGIARKYGVSVDDLRRANNIKSSHRLFSGTRLTIPGQKIEAAPKAGGSTDKPAPAPAKDDEAPSNTAKSESAPIYLVKRGDTLFEIAAAKGVSVKQIQDWNGLKNSSDLHEGDRLKLGPGSDSGTVSAKATVEAPQGPEKMSYKVCSGDSLGKIAGKHGVSIEKLREWNKLGNKSTIIAGQTLTLYSDKPIQVAKAETPAVTSEKASSGTAKAEAKATESSYEVKSGDTLGKIASKNGVSLKDLLAWNGLKSSSVLKPGQKLVLRGGSAKAEEPAKEEAKAAQPSKTTHVVKKGDNPSAIAQKYKVKLSDLYKWNGWSKDPVLDLGDKVVIQK